MQQRVYEYKTVMGDNDKRETEMAKAIGSVRPDISFVPNSYYFCDEEILEFVEYAVILVNSKKYWPAKGMLNTQDVF